MIGYRLSRTGVAKHPYYISLLGIGLWSVEELCYFLVHNPALIDDSITCQGLVRWLAEEFHMTDTALAMERSMKLGADTGEVLLPLLRDSGYLETHEIRAFTKRLQTMAAGGASLLLKMKGDALTRNKKYREAVAVYIQAEENTKKGNAKALSSILHNRGVALMQLLSYEEAYRAFRRAAALDDTPQRRRTCLLAAGLAKPRDLFIEEAEEIGADDAMVEEVMRTLDELASQSAAPPVDPYKELARIRREYSDSFSS